MRRAAGFALAAVMTACAAAAAQALPSYRVDGDAIRERLAEAGDASRGKQVVASRDSNCLLCHSVPDAGTRIMGNLGPPLSGVGVRLSEAQLRLRIVDGSRLNADTIMPPYYRTTGLQRVARNFEGKTILTAAQVEDVVAYLVTLKD